MKRKTPGDWQVQHCKFPNFIEDFGRGGTPYSDSLFKMICCPAMRVWALLLMPSCELLLIHLSNEAKIILFLEWALAK